MGGTYDNDSYGTRQSVVINVPALAANNDVDATMARYMFFTQVKINAINAVPTVLGKDGTSALNFLIDTTSFGAVCYGTETILSTSLAATLTASNVAAASELVVQQASATDTGACQIMVDYQESYA